MLTKILPSYLYTQYADDVNLQSFVSAYNTMTQEYLDWFNTINLPIYTVQSGTMLDWVATGLYGIPRPTIANGFLAWSAPLNTWAMNTIPLNGIDESPAGTPQYITDDYYKRIITWFFYKGDGQVFTVNWLKRRIIRFCLGVNGFSPNISTTPNVSVVFELGNVVTITINTNISITALVSAQYGQAEYGVTHYGETEVTLDSGNNTGAGLWYAGNNSINSGNNIGWLFTAPPNTGGNVITRPSAIMLKNAIDSGILPLPFQFTYQVNVI